MMGKFYRKTLYFDGKNHGFPVDFPLNQSIVFFKWYISNKQGIHVTFPWPQVDGFTLNALLGALARGSQWRWALWILQGQLRWANIISGLERGYGGGMMVIHPKFTMQPSKNRDIQWRIRFQA